MTKFPELFRDLAAPFDGQGEVKILPKAGGKEYITARTVQNRLDDVLGPEGWRDEYRWLPGNDAMECRLSIRLPDGSWLTKVDAGARSTTGDDSVDDMGAASDALKRAAVKLGVARYLYRDGVPPFVLGADEAARRKILIHRVPLKANGVVTTAVGDGVLPSDIDNGRVSVAPGVAPPEPHPAAPGVLPLGRQPADGRQLFAWARRMGTELGLDIVQSIEGWARRSGFSTNFSNWDVGVVSEAFLWAAKDLHALGKVVLPPEIEAAVQEAPRAARAAGPLTLDPKDPHLKIKIEIRDLAKELAGNVLGSTPNEVQAMTWLTARLVQRGQPKINSIRNTSSLSLLKMIRDILVEDQQDVRRLS